MFRKMLMLNPVKTAQDSKGFQSFGATAKALLESHPDNDWGMQPRSLETQIGKLDKGEVVWWINHPKVAQALCSLLDLSLQDLGLHSNADAISGFRFSEFPGLKPLDLRREKPWRIGKEEAEEKSRDKRYGKRTLEEWLNPNPMQWRAPYDFHWLHVGDALERRLLTQHLAATSRFKVVFTRTLGAVTAQLLDAKPLILVVEGDVSEEDFKTLGLRNGSAGLLVIAPVPMYKKTSALKSIREFESWERLSLQDEERRQFDLATPVALEGWTWTLQPDWRSALLQWVERRLDRQNADTLFDAQSMSLWLERFDPLGQWFETTADVLQLCEMGHFGSHKKLPKPNDVEAGRKLTQLLFRESPLQRSDKIQQWAVARWNRLDLAWRGALSMDGWLSMLPANQLPPSAEEVLAIASAKTALERKNAATRVIRLLDAGNPDVLRASGLLREDANGRLDFEHPTLVRLIVRDKLMRQIAEEAAQSWGIACFDADRRMLVDAALDAISMDTLMQAVHRLLLENEDEANSAATLGASEALFVAIGRRVTNREAIHEKFLPLLKQLAETVFGRLELEGSAFNLPAPWSRPLDSPAQQLSWIGACWAWSLLVEAPSKPVNELPPNWLFPGWSASLPPAPDWLTKLWPEERTERLPSAWRDFFKVADEWVKDWDQPLDNAPRILSIALLGRAAHGAWTANPAWWEDLIARRAPWSDDALIARFKVAGKDAAVRLWPSYLAFEMSAKELSNQSIFTLDLIQRSGVRIWLLAQMSPSEGMAYLARAELNYLSSTPQLLPPAFRAPLLLERCKFIRFESFADTAPFIERFGPSVVSALPELLAHDWLGSAAAEYLWAWDTATAERMLSDEAIDWAARYSLMHACPISKIAIVTSAMLEKPEIFSSKDYSFWAKSRLPISGSNAQAVLEIIRSTSLG
jgi:hypothetical protein